jgi:thiamine transport system substrate-binding protein
VLRLVCIIVASLIGACSFVGGGPSPTAPTRLVVLTHDSFEISASVIDSFEAAHGVTVDIVKGGDAGEMVNKAILTKDVPLADVLYGVDNTFLSRALDADIFDPYVPTTLSQVPPDLTAGTNGAVSPIDYGDVCLNVDKEAFETIPAPARLEDLADPRYRAMLVVENPATSSPGLAFLLATIGHFGTDGEYTWQDYWADLRANEVLVENDWNAAYYNSFSGGAGEGDRPIVVSYATSPVAEIVFAEGPIEAPTTDAVTEGCFRQVEYAGILRGAKAPELARKFVDFMLAPEFQADIPLTMFVFPANPEAAVPEVFRANAAAVPSPIVMDPAEVAANRDAWVEEWTNVVLR